MTHLYTTLGDTTLTLTTVESLSSGEDATYNLRFTDGPTDKSVTLSYTSENEALLTIAAWLAADEPTLGDLEPLREGLRNRLGDAAALFLP